MLAGVFNCVFDDPGHLDEHAFAFGNGVKRNNCLPLSTIHAPVRHETRGEGETIRSVSGKLLVQLTKLRGKLLLLENNSSFPFAVEIEQVPMVCFEAFSLFGGASNACFSLADHCFKEELVSDRKQLKDSISCFALLDVVWH